MMNLTGGQNLINFLQSLIEIPVIQEVHYEEIAKPALTSDDRNNTPNDFDRWLTKRSPNQHLLQMSEAIHHHSLTKTRSNRPIPPWGPWGHRSACNSSDLIHHKKIAISKPTLTPDSRSNQSPCLTVPGNIFDEFSNYTGLLNNFTLNQNFLPASQPFFLLPLFFLSWEQFFQTEYN